MLGLQVLIARKLGGEQLGRYAVLLSVCNIVAVVLPLGFQTIASYFVAIYANANRGHALRHFAVQAYGQTIAMAFVALLFGSQILFLFGRDLMNFAEHWHYVVAAAFGLALMQLSASILISLRVALIGIAGDAILRPLVTAVALFAAFAAVEVPDVVATLFQFLAAGFVAIGLIYTLLAASKIRTLPDTSEPLNTERRQWWFYAAPWTMLALAGDFFFDIDLLLLTPYLDLQSLAVFGIAARLVSLASYGVNAVYAVSLPDLFQTGGEAADPRFIQQIKRTNTIAVLMSCVMLVGAYFIAPLILNFLGPVFAEAAMPFAILCLCPLVRSVFGPTALMLSMHQRPYSSLPPIAVGFTTLLIGNAMLVPTYHIEGAAWSAVLATLLWSGSLWILAKQKTGIDVSIFSGFLARNHSAQTPQ